MINISNSTSKDNPRCRSAELVRPAPPTRPRAPARDATEHASPVRYGRILTVGRVVLAVGRVVLAVGRVVLSWLAAIPRRLGDRLFAMNDTEAYWHDWQITKTQGGLGRRYRDLRFDTLAECPRCHGAGVASGITADLSCLPCLGTGRVTRGEAS